MVKQIPKNLWTISRSVPRRTQRKKSKQSSLQIRLNLVSKMMRTKVRVRLSLLRKILQRLINISRLGVFQIHSNLLLRNKKNFFRQGKRRYRNTLTFRRIGINKMNLNPWNTLSDLVIILNLFKKFLNNPAELRLSMIKRIMWFIQDGSQLMTTTIACLTLNGNLLLEVSNSI